MIGVDGDRRLRAVVEGECLLRVGADDRSAWLDRARALREGDDPAIADALRVAPKGFPRVRCGLVAPSPTALRERLGEVMERVEDGPFAALEDRGRFVFREGTPRPRREVGFLYPGLEATGQGSRIDEGHAVPPSPSTARKAAPGGLVRQWGIDRLLAGEGILPGAVAGFRGGSILALAASGALSADADWEEGLRRLESLLRSLGGRRPEAHRPFTTLDLKAPSLPIYAEDRGGRVEPDSDGLGGLAASRMLDRAAFGATVRAMHDDGVRLFVEIGLRGDLAREAEEALAGRGAVVLAAGEQGIPRLASLRASLFAEGVGLGEEVAHSPVVVPSACLPDWLATQAAVGEFLRTMDSFLETQREVLEAFLEGAANDLAGRAVERGIISRGPG